MPVLFVKFCDPRNDFHVNLYAEDEKQPGRFEKLGESGELGNNPYRILHVT